MRELYASRLIPMFLAAIAGCHTPEDDTARPERVVAQDIRGQTTLVLQQARQERENRSRELREMDGPALARELATESLRGTEPFNSRAFAEMVSRDHSEVPELARLITNPDRSSLLALLALRRLSPEDYRRLNSGLRTSILVDALAKSEYFNTWGLPHAHWEGAARALIDAGPAARNALRELMKDRRAAPVWGLVEYQQYQYRVCDYAWAMLNVISGREVSIPQDPAERDRLQRADMD